MISLDLDLEGEHVAWVDGKPMPGKFVLSCKGFSEVVTAANEAYITMDELVSKILSFEYRRRSDLGKHSWCEWDETDIFHSISRIGRDDGLLNYRLWWCSGEPVKKARIDDGDGDQTST